MISLKGMTTSISRAVVNHIKFYEESPIPDLRIDPEQGEQLMVVVRVPERSVGFAEVIDATYNPLSRTVKIQFFVPITITGEWLSWFVPAFKRALRHELEHFRQHKRSGNLFGGDLVPQFTMKGQIPGRIEQGPWTSIGMAARYLLNPLEVEAHVVGIKMEAQTRKVHFVRVLREKINEIHWLLLDSNFDINRSNTLISQVYDIWAFYALARFPSLRKIR